LPDIGALTGWLFPGAAVASELNRPFDYLPKEIMVAARPGERSRCTPGPHQFDQARPRKSDVGSLDKVALALDVAVADLLA
jgi:hypothetical protein